MDDKDVIIARQKEQIQVLLERVKELEEEIARLKKNSANSSKPPSFRSASAPSSTLNQDSPGRSSSPSGNRN